MNLIIRNGKVVSSKESRKADIFIENDKVAAIIPNGQDKSNFVFNSKAKITEIDATGKLVMPGGIDVHTHLDMPFMGASSTDDFESGTIAAAFGGTTSIIDYVIPEKNQNLADALSVWHKKAEGKAVIDYGFHMAIVPPVDKILPELPRLVEAGVTSIKCFLAYKNSLMIDDASLFQLMREAKKSGILVCIHAENGEIIDLLTKEYIENKKTEPAYHALSRPPILEGESTARVLKLAKLAEVPVYFVHLSTKNALSEIKRARKNLQQVYTETGPQYLLLDDNRYNEEDFNGAKYVMSPPLRDKKHTEYLLKSVKKSINVIATDHCPFNFSKEKQMGINDFSKIPNGIPGIETRLPLMFHQLVNKDKLSLHKFVELNCTNPARIFGMQDKGDIEAGFDADIAIWDPDLEWTIQTKKLHQNVDYTPFEGFKVKGKPITVISRGNIIINNNKFKAKAGSGKFIKRR